MHITTFHHRPRTALLALALCACAPACASTYTVHDQAEFDTAAAALQPGDVIVLADGTWKDTRLLTGTGTASAPIALRAQTPGKVVLTGGSDLRLAGEYLVAQNLVFRDGHAPGDAVVSFRENSKRRANHSRVTGLVIDGYSVAGADDKDQWVMFYGANNRLDHSQLSGKNNMGTTVVVVRDQAQGLVNNHRIDHNWFGPRVYMGGANGAETLRIGDSDSSLMEHSGTVVEMNWFEACDGEVEAISNKSNGNTIRNNVFYRVAGTVTLRHGNDNRVENNVFLGDGKENTGGVRVINKRQVVRNNYFQGLRGGGGQSALSIAHGAVSPPLSGYAIVEDAIIERNTFVDVSRITFGSNRKDATGVNQRPVGSRFSNNLVVNPDNKDPFRVVFEDMAGVVTNGNVQSPVATTKLASGVSGKAVPLVTAATGLQVPSPALGAVGANPALEMIQRDETGVSWYPKHGEWTE